MLRSFSVRFLLIALLFAGVACRSSRQAFQDGDYETAIRMCVSKLRDNPRHKKSIEVIAQAYPQFLNKAQSDIQRYKSSPEVGKWVSVIRVYERIHNVHDAIQTCPKAWEVIGSPMRFDASLQEAKRNASQNYYDEGMKFLAKGTFRDARTAYEHFEQAQAYYPNITADIKARLQEAKLKATIHVELCLMPLNQAFTQYGITDRVSQNAFSSYASSINKRAFMECDFVQEPQPDSEVIDDRIALAYTRFMPEASQYKEETIQREKVIKKDSTEETIRATISLREKSIKASCTIEIRITEAETGKMLLNETVQASYNWRTDWIVMLKGDTRALSDKERKQLGEREEASPTNQAIFEALQKDIAKKVQAKIDAYYR